MNTAFVVQGTLFCAGAVLLTRAIGHRGPSTFVAFAAANAIGNVVVATVPSGGAGTAWVHVAGAVVAIVGGNAAVLTGSPSVSAARPYRVASVGLGAAGLLSFASLAIGTVDVDDGAPARRGLGADERLHDHRLADALGGVLLIRRR